MPPRPPLLRIVVTVALLAVPAMSAAQTVTPANPDFLFRRPHAEVGFRAGWLFNRGSSDWYDFVTDQLTLEPGDFNSIAVGVDVGIWLPGPFTLVGGIEATRTNPGSEYRRLVDNNRQPINQKTRLETTHLTAGIKYAFANRGRAIGRLAWIPRRFSPYLAAGGGATYYELEQVGDFVDFRDRSVFPATFTSTGWTPHYFVGGGADILVARHLVVTADIRYRRAAGVLNETWVDFDPLDLSGAQSTVGIAWQF